MLNKIFILFIFTGFAIIRSDAQIRRCGTYELHQQRLQTDSAYRDYYAGIGERMQAWQKNADYSRSVQAVITIPVVVHVLYNTDEQNISDAQIQSQIPVLNNDYTAGNANINSVPPGFRGRIGNAGLNFCLATITPSGGYTVGIERKYTNNTSFNVGDDQIKYSSLGGLDAWDCTRYLNIWVCNLEGGSVLGYTQMPGGSPETDGCVILYKVFGNTGSQFTGYSAYSLGRTATHEIGHWLGLFHVWGDDGGACWGTDHIADTPNQADCTYGCPPFPKKDSCTDTLPGVMYMNYLDYTDDACMSMFSAGQVAVMHAILDTVRASILTSNGCRVPSGLANINAETFIDIYPNPGRDNINLDMHLPSSTVLNVTACDNLGNAVFIMPVNKAGEQVLKIDITSLKPGLYILIVKTDEGSIVKRFAVIH